MRLKPDDIPSLWNVLLTLLHLHLEVHFKSLAVRTRILQVTIGLDKSVPLCVVKRIDDACVVLAVNHIFLGNVFLVDSVDQLDLVCEGTKRVIKLAVFQVVFVFRYSQYLFGLALTAQRIIRVGDVDATIPIAWDKVERDDIASLELYDVASRLLTVTVRTLRQPGVKLRRLLECD